MATNLGNQFQKPDFCSISLRKEVEDFPIICANRRNFLLTGHGLAFEVISHPVVAFYGSRFGLHPNSGNRQERITLPPVSRKCPA